MTQFAIEYDFRIFFPGVQALIKIEFCIRA